VSNGTTGLFRTEGHESPLKVAVSNAQARADTRFADQSPIYFAPSSQSQAKIISRKDDTEVNSTTIEGVPSRLGLDQSKKAHMESTMLPAKDLSQSFILQPDTSGALSIPRFQSDMVSIINGHRVLDDLPLPEIQSLHGIAYSGSKDIGPFADKLKPCAPKVGYSSYQSPEKYPRPGKAQAYE